MPELSHLIHAVSTPILARPFPNHPTPDPDSLNVVLRSYAPGARLGPHVDRMDWFTEPIFTLVIRGSRPPGEGLLFQTDNPDPHSVTPFWIPETDGLL